MREVTTSTPSAMGSAPPESPVPEPRATKGTPNAAHVATTAWTSRLERASDHEGRHDAEVRQAVAFVGAQLGEVGDERLLTDDPPQPLGDRADQVSPAHGIEA